MDQTTYFKGAQAFANGNLLATDPDISNHFSPLYQYFLGIVFLVFGVNLNVIWITQFFLGTASSLLIYAIGNQYFKPAVSFCAALLFTFYGGNWLYESTIFRASFITFLELMSCLLLIQYARHSNFLWMTLSAIFLSLLIQSRTNYFLIVPFALTYLWRKVFCLKNKGKTMLIRYLFIFSLTSIPLLLWVHVVHGKWGFYDNMGPENLLISNLLDYDPRIYPSIETYAEIKSKIPLKTASIINHFFQDARERPLLFLQLYMKKIYYYFNNYEVPNAFNYYLLQDFSPILSWGSIPYALIGSLGIIGFVLLRKHQNNWTLLHAYFIANILMYLPFLVLSRYRLSMVPFLALFSAYTLWVMFQKLKQRRWPSLSVILICFVLLIFFEKTDPLPSGKIRIVDYMNVGTTFLKNSTLEDDYYGYKYLKKAWDHYRELQPASPKPDMLLAYLSTYYAQEGEKYRQKKDLQKEIEVLKKSIFFNYAYSISHYNYALALYNNKNYKKSLLENLQAITLNPNISFLPHLMAGNIYINYYRNPFWTLYHWQKAYNLMTGDEKKSLSLRIKKLQDQIKHQNKTLLLIPDNFPSNIQRILQKQIKPFINFQDNLSLPDVIFSWSSNEVDQYVMSLYQRLILSSGENVAAIYYQLGIMHLKNKAGDFVALYYFKKAWDKGIQFQRLDQFIKKLEIKKATMEIS